jgi:hypothetical protein
MELKLSSGASFQERRCFFVSVLMMMISPRNVTKAVEKIRVRFAEKEQRAWE